MKYYPEIFPPIDTSQETYCVYLTSQSNLRLLYNYQNDNRYHSYMDYTIVGNSVIRSNVNNNAYVERTEPFSRYCLQSSDGINILDDVLLSRDYVYTDFWFPIFSVIAVVAIIALVYKIMFKRFIK